MREISLEDKLREVYKPKRGSSRKNQSVFSNTTLTLNGITRVPPPAEIKRYVEEQKRLNTD